VSETKLCEWDKLVPKAYDTKESSRVEPALVQDFFTGWWETKREVVNVKPGTERIRTPGNEVRDAVRYDAKDGGAEAPHRRHDLEKVVDIRRRIGFHHRTTDPRNRSG